jgi:hypothetical protein
MSRKHYIAIAAIFADARSFTKDPIALALVASRLADTFARENQRFDRVRFLAACEGIDHV